MVKISPIIRLDKKESYCILNIDNIDLIVVRLQDLVSPNTFEFTDKFYQIIMSGGLHNFLGFRGKILLSLIMKDEIVANFNPKRYAEAIYSLMPDSFTTIDGETYELESYLSEKELKRITSETIELLEIVPDLKPIGLVKGCTGKQIKNHSIFLRKLGIEDLIFHVGDFFWKNNQYLINRARFYTSIIRNFAKNLILYGFGSQNLLAKFSFADRYITYMHCISANKKIGLFGTKKAYYGSEFDPKMIEKNFEQLLINIKSLRFQTKLYKEG